MKKLSGILLSAVLAMGACAGLTGCSLNSYTYSRAGDYSVGASEFSAADISSIDIDWVSGEVNVVYADVENIAIAESATRGDITSDFTMRYLAENGELKIKYARSGKWRFGKLQKTLTVTLPTTVELEKLSVDTASADFDADMLVCKNANIDTASGDVAIGGGRIAELSIDTASGEADIRLDSADRVEADTASGDVDIVLCSAPTSIDIDTASGDVLIKLPDDVGFTLEYGTASGRLDTEFSVTQSKDTYVCGDGAVRIIADTASGDLTLKKISE
ncbi:MAG: DUF4097 domain-containing protein [Roseburia sp.]|nr:DUF4097 domain-containing protein [Roseburia sp.]